MLVRQGTSLKELHVALEGRGVKVSYKTLSEIVNEGDVAELLQVGGSGSQREFPTWAADFLAHFLPKAQEGKFKKPQYPAMMRAALVNWNKNGPQGALLRVEPDPQPSSLPMPASPPPADPLELAAAAGRAQGLAQDDAVMDAAAAAAFLGVSTAMLRKSVPAYRRFGKGARGDRWRKSDLLA